MKTAARPQPHRASHGRLAGHAGFLSIRLGAFLLVFALFLGLAGAAFFTTRTEMQDKRAKEVLRSAEQALEIYRTEQGTYAATPAHLGAIDGSLSSVHSLTVRGGMDSFMLSVESASGRSGGGTFTLAKDANSRVVRDCTNPGHGACRSVVDVAGNRW
jgi:type II secretory pathway pseudopilin PulG